MENNKRVLVLGQYGFVGKAIHERLQVNANVDVINYPINAIDLADRGAVHGFMEFCKPDVVIIAAGRVGGIQANVRYPVKFLRDNLLIQISAFDACQKAGVQQVIFLASSCMYSPNAQLPFKEEDILCGDVEPTNAGYAIAKRTGITLAKAYQDEYELDTITLVPPNLYGPGDHYEESRSHAIAGMIRRIHEAKESGAESVVVWGTGKPMREWMFIGDLVDLVVLLIKGNVDQCPSVLNVGTGESISTYNLAHLIADVVGFTGTIELDKTKPDGMMNKVMDVSKMRRVFDYGRMIEIRRGLEITYSAFLQRNCADNKVINH